MKKIIAYINDKKQINELLQNPLHIKIANNEITASLEHARQNDQEGKRLRDSFASKKGIEVLLNLFTQRSLRKFNPPERPNHPDSTQRNINKSKVQEGKDALQALLAQIKKEEVEASIEGSVAKHIREGSVRSDIIDNDSVSSASMASDSEGSTEIDSDSESEEEIFGKLTDLISVDKEEKKYKKIEKKNKILAGKVLKSLLTEKENSHHLSTITGSIKKLFSALSTADHSMRDVVVGILNNFIKADTANIELLLQEENGLKKLVVLAQPKEAIQILAYIRAEKPEKAEEINNLLMDAVVREYTIKSNRVTVVKRIDRLQIDEPIKKLAIMAQTDNTVVRILTQMRDEKPEHKEEIDKALIDVIAHHIRVEKESDEKLQFLMQMFMFIFAAKDRSSQQTEIDPQKWKEKLVDLHINGDENERRVSEKFLTMTAVSMTAEEPIYRETIESAWLDIAAHHMRSRKSDALLRPIADAFINYRLDRQEPLEELLDPENVKNDQMRLIPVELLRLFVQSKENVKRIDKDLVSTLTRFTSGDDDSLVSQKLIATLNTLTQSENPA